MLSTIIPSGEAWGRHQGRHAYSEITQTIDRNRDDRCVSISLASIERMDVTFAEEALLEASKRYKGQLLVILVDITHPDVEENIDAAACRKDQPVVVKHSARAKYLGPKPSPGTRAAFNFALGRGSARASEFAANSPGMSAQNASMKFRELWQKGYLLREELTAESGGIEYLYIAPT